MKKNLLLRKLYQGALALTLAAAVTACGSSQSGSASGESAQTGASAAQTAQSEAPAADTQAADQTAQTEQAPDDQLARILAAGVIRIGTEGTYSPRTYHNEKDELVGYDVDVARAIADKLGVQAEFIETVWDSMVAGMDADRFDIIANDMTPTDERREKFDFTEPYSYVHRVLIVHKDNDGIQSFEDLDGKTVATEVSSTTVEIAEGYGASITPITGSEEAVQMVLTKRSDAVILPEVMFYQLLRENPDIALKSVDTLEDAEIAAIPVNKGEERLVEALNQALDELRADGTLAKISEQYFGYDLSSN